MNARRALRTQALILFVASYKNCSLHDTYCLGTSGKAPAPLGAGQLAHSLLYPLVQAH
ncbi:hypothetical protein [Pseudomonas sp. 24 E 1]|nr:hypothetical protein [Pseudomonas sp. 24 R 17]CRM01652.1 hypothetical protein [Pseudomonas sp. 24 E 1]CRM14834.1 hypothetical protein [Pseudomonas sp. 52 E 6]CRM48455.1 hypothetical protein [Pseudomonas sp. 35 E 8]CRM50173.1 hypothetical protein [Pseudomonas sp. 58 R 12]